MCILLLSVEQTLQQLAQVYSPPRHPPTCCNRKAARMTRSRVEVEVVMGKKRCNSRGCLVSDSQIAGIKPPDEPPDGSFFASRDLREISIEPALRRRSGRFPSERKRFVALRRAETSVFIAVCRPFEGCLRRGVEKGNVVFITSLFFVLSRPLPLPFSPAVLQAFLAAPPGRRMRVRLGTRQRLHGAPSYRQEQRETSKVKTKRNVEQAVQEGGGKTSIIQTARHGHFLRVTSCCQKSSAAVFG